MSYSRASRAGIIDTEPGALQAAVELRFSYSLLEKLIAYLDRATINMKLLKPSSTFSRRSSFRTASRDIKFFSKVVLPLMEKYFSTHRNYFIAIATATNNVGAASLKEKEMVAAIFCKLASLLRNRLTAFGPDVRITVRCLQVLVKCIDAKSLVKNCPEFIRTSMLTFFNNTADDLGQTIVNLQDVTIKNIIKVTLLIEIYLIVGKIQPFKRNSFKNFNFPSLREYSDFTCTNCIV